MRLAELARFTDDVDDACEGLADRRLDLEWPPAGYEWGRSAYLRDPDGDLLELVEGD